MFSELLDAHHVLKTQSDDRVKTSNTSQITLVDGISVLIIKEEPWNSSENPLRAFNHVDYKHLFHLPFSALFVLHT